MKKLFIFLMIVSFKQSIFSQGVKIGGTGDPDATAILEVDGGSGKGFLLPRMTSTSMNALNATDGMIVYNSTDASIYLRKSGAWQKIAEGNASGGGFTLPLVSTQNVYPNVLDLTNTSTEALSGAIRGFSESGSGIIGGSNTGRAAYFSSITGHALITGTGKVGIGTSSPTYPLTLDANGNGFVHKGGGVEIGTSVSAIGGMLQTFTNHPLRFGAGSNTTRMIITQTGELGIGTSIPMARIHATWNNDELLQLDNTTSLATGITVKQLFKTGSYYTGAFGTTGQSASTARISFFTGSSLNSASLAERMSILNNGYVGIGTIAPAAKLDVIGKAIFHHVAGENAAVEIKGPIKVSGSAPAAFVVEVPLPNGLPGSSLVIDNPACNGKPGAMLFVIANSSIGQPVSVLYDTGVAKWKIIADSHTLGYLLPGVRFNVLVIDK